MKKISTRQAIHSRGRDTSGSYMMGDKSRESTQSISE